MTLKPRHLLLLAATLLLAAGLSGRFGAPVQSYSSEAADAQTDFLTRGRSTAYGGIDHWAYYGMKAEALAARLQREGYACTLPQPAKGQPKLSGVHDAVCTRQLLWPLARTLTIRAQIDYDQRARLVSASAASLGADGQPLRQRVTSMLRDHGWMEPASLTVRGIGIDSADMLARYAVDALTPQGWYAQCFDDSSAGICAHMASERRKNGLPPLQKGPVATGAASDIAPALERVRLLPVVVRGADHLPADSLLVRMEQDLLWLDFIGRDLAGGAFTVAVGLDSKGGTPVTLLAKVGAETRTVALGGTPNVSGNGGQTHLVPLALPGPGQPAVWIYLHERPSDDELGRLAQTLPQVDERFVPRVLQNLIGTMTASTASEDILGLYSPLNMVERRADALRKMRVAEWLDRAQATRMIETTYPDDKITRAAWAMASCDPGPQASAPADCWQGFTSADPDAAAMLRSEVSAMQVLYAGLDPAHPLRLHIQKMGQALAATPAKTDWDLH
jgi:hypothetical protein